MSKLSATQVNEAKNAVDRVQGIDKTVEWIGGRVEEESEAWGEKVKRDIFGQNCLTQFTHAQLGELVFCAVINALLFKRQMCINNHQDVVEFPDQPCPIQHTNLEEAM